MPLQTQLLTIKGKLNLVVLVNGLEALWLWDRNRNLRQQNLLKALTLLFTQMLQIYAGRSHTELLPSLPSCLFQTLDNADRVGHASGSESGSKKLVRKA